MTTAQLSPTAPRVTFREPVSNDGFIDAAWWPRTHDLTAELPALLDDLWTAGREITHVTYNLAFWGHAPRRQVIAGRVVRLGGFASGDAHSMRLSDAWGRERIDILVIAPDTDPDVAERAMHIAGESGNPGRAEDILAAANRTDA